MLRLGWNLLLAASFNITWHRLSGLWEVGLELVPAGLRARLARTTFIQFYEYGRRWTAGNRYDETHIRYLNVRLTIWLSEETWRSHVLLESTCHSIPFSWCFLSPLWKIHISREIIKCLYSFLWTNIHFRCFSPCSFSSPRVSVCRSEPY